jgi:hypothetical protein
VEEELHTHLAEEDSHPGPVGQAEEVFRSRLAAADHTPLVAAAAAAGHSPLVAARTRPVAPAHNRLAAAAAAHIHRDRRGVADRIRRRHTVHLAGEGLRIVRAGEHQSLLRLVGEA